MAPIARLFAEVGLDSRKFDKGVKGVKSDLTGMQKSFQTLGRGLSGIGLGLGGIVAGFGALQLGALAFDLAKNADEANRVAASFNDLAKSVGSSGSEMLKTLREVTGNTLSDTDLQLAANKALTAGVAQNTEQIADLLEVAEARSRAFGITTQEAFNRLAQSLATGRQEGLRSLGIILDTQQAYEDYAESIDKPVEALTQLDKTQALVNATIRQTASETANLSFDDFTSGVRAYEAATANLKDAIGTLLASKPVIDFLIAFSNQVNNTATALNNIGTEAESFGSVFLRTFKDTTSNTESFKQLSDQIRAYETELARLGEQRKNLDPLSEAFRFLGIRQLLVSQMLSQVRDRMDEMQASASEASHQIDQMASGRAAAAMDRLAQSTANAAGEARGATTDFARLNEILDQNAADRAAAVRGRIETTQRQRGGGVSRARDLGAELVGMGMSIKDSIALTKQAEENLASITLSVQDTSEAHIRNNTLIEQSLSPLTEAKEAMLDNQRATKQWGNSVSNVGGEFEKIKGMASGIISGALSGTTAGIDASDFFPREDAVDENARRLADIAVNGLRPTEWLDEFKSEVPDIFQQLAESSDPQQTAKELLRDFQAGLVPELIDKEAAKKLIETALGKEAAIQDLAQEIAGEMGIGVQKAQEILSGTQTAQLKLTPTLDTAAIDPETLDTEGLAATFSEGMMSALEGEGLGTRMISKVIQQLAGQLTRLNKAGKDAGKQWGDGFLATVGENVPAELIGILTDLVTPGVMANLATETGLTGAE